MKRTISGINEKIRTVGPIKILQQIVENKRLDKVSPIIEQETARFNRKSHHISMNLGITRIDDQTIDQRQTHQVTVGIISTILAEKLGLNINLVKVMASMHDVGHTFLGHDGEYMISDYMEEHELGVLRHNARAIRELVYRQRVQDNIMESIEILHPEYSDNKLGKISKSLWKVFDGIQSHNGEATNSEFVPNILKTKQDFLDETMKCYTEKGFDKQIVPATPEACLLKLSDIIAYVGRDLADGLKSGILTSLDDEYISILEGFGIEKEQLNRWILAGKYDNIERVIEIALIKDVIQSSRKNLIKTKTRVSLSKTMSQNMYKLRDKNYKAIGAYTIKETEKQVFTRGIESLSTYFSDLLVNEGLTHKLGKLSKDNERARNLRTRYKDTMYEGFVNYILDTTPEDIEFVREVIKRTAAQKGKADISKTEIVKKTGLFMSSNYLASLNDIEFIGSLKPINKITKEQYQNLMTSYRKSSETNAVSTQFMQMLDTQKRDRINQGIDEER